MSGNESQALMMFRGCVHECDRIEKKHDAVVPSAEFFFIFSNALFHLSLLEADENNPHEYVIAAEDSVGAGLSRFPQSQDLVILKARIMLTKTNNIADAAVLDATLLETSDIVSRLLKSTLEDEGCSVVFSQFGWALLGMAEEKDEFDLRSKILEYALLFHSKALNSHAKCFSALKGYGACELFIANDLIDGSDVQDDESDSASNRADSSSINVLADTTTAQLSQQMVEKGALRLHSGFLRVC